jgi:hypothetical protein
MRSLSISVLVLLAACGREQPQPAPEANVTNESVPAEPSPVAPPTASEMEQSQDAGAALRDYYALIETRDYEGAARLRSDRQADAKRLADNFKAYESYKVQVGVPGRPAASGGWLWVRVPVMITGRYRGGSNFGSTGTVILRRSTSDAASPAERRWRVYGG